MNEDTYEEVVKFKLSRLSVYVFLSTIFVVLVGLIIALLVFTPLKYYLPGTGYGLWSEALDHAIGRIRAWGADALVVSLGVDAFKDDPISFFKLDSPDFFDAGRRIGKIGLPTLFCMEGGYAIEAVGINAVNVLEGFEDA